jgi:surface polysaccharide O-acyltransferase-like enzyme
MSKWLSAHAFLVYIVHALFVTYVAYALRHLDWNPLVKFVVVGCVAVLLSYTAAALLRRIPAVRKVV